MTQNSVYVRHIRVTREIVAGRPMGVPFFTDIFSFNRPPEGAMKLVIAMMQHETNTFSPLTASYEAFGRAIGFDAPPHGQTVIDTFAGTDMALGAFLDLALARGAEIVAPIAAYAEPCGAVDDDAFDRIAEHICAAVAEGCDAVLLDLHGAMVTQSHDDGEGELLRRIRAVDAEVPIGVALDFHANMTSAMVENATVITGYLTYPHIDMYETGERCGRTLLAHLDGAPRPFVVWGRLPLISAMLRQTPSAEPMLTPMSLAIAAEASGTVHNASVFGGFPLADIPHVSLSAVITCSGDDAAGRTLRDEILTAAWNGREGFVFNPEPVADTIARAKGLTDGPVIIADYGDNAGAGGQMDDMTVVREIVAQGLSDVAVGPVWDPETLDQMRAAGIGAVIDVNVGGKTNSPAVGIVGEPLPLRGTVKTITDGRFRLEGDMMAGFPVNLEGTAVLDTGDLEIIVSGSRSEPYAPQYFTHAGIDPATKRYVVLKSRQHFRAGFEPIARHVLMAGGRGVCREEFDTLPFKHLKRPIYPIDGGCTWGVKDKN
jgi:microcystin degradation protein MlrC